MITQNSLALLAFQNSQKKLITNEYIEDVNNPNFKYIQTKFFNLDPVDKVKLLNTWSWLFATVTQTISYYVWNPNINFTIWKLVEDYLCLWFATFWVERINWKLEVKYLPSENYYRENGIDHIVRAYQKTQNYKVTYYYLITSYIWGKIENRLYESVDFNLENLKEVPLDTIDETSNLQPVINTWLEKVFWVIKDDDLEDQPISLIDKIKNIVYSIDRKIVMFDTQFLQNVESFVLLKGINLPIKLIEKYNDKWKLNFADLWRYLTTDQDWKIEFINNQNVLLEKAIDYEQVQIQKISSITNVPMDFLGWTWTAWAIWEWSRELLHWSFIKRIENIRSLFDKYIWEVVKLLAKENWIDDTYIWPDIFSKNTQQLIEELEKAVSIWILSKRTALKRYLDLDENELDLEFNLLENENTIWWDTEPTTSQTGSSEENAN